MIINVINKLDEVSYSAFRKLPKDAQRVLIRPICLGVSIYWFCEQYIPEMKDAWDDVRNEVNIMAEKRIGTNDP